jgi:hypothetical protein
MKKLLTAILICLTFFCEAQTDSIPKDENGKYTYSEIVSVDSISASELYSRAKQWFVSAYNSSKSVIQNDDIESRTIFGKAIIPVTFTAMGSASKMGNVHYEITVSCKDGRLKFVITNFYFKNNYNNNLAFEIAKGPDNGYRKKDWERAREQVDTNMRALILDLKKSMSKKSISSTKDW